MWNVLKTIKTGGIEYPPGSTIPDGILEPRAINVLVKAKQIEKIHENIEKPVMTIPYYIEGEEHVAEVKVENVANMFRLLQLTSGKKPFGKVLSEMDDYEALVILSAIDTRQEAIEQYAERAKGMTNAAHV